MVPCLHVFSLGWLSVVAGCCAAEAGQLLSGFFGRRDPPIIAHGKEAAAGSHRYEESQRRRVPATGISKWLGGAGDREKYKLRERRNSAGEKTVAVWGCVAAWQESPRNLSISRPPPDRQVAVWGTAFKAQGNVAWMQRITRNECRFAFKTPGSASFNLPPIFSPCPLFSPQLPGISA
jgi:hypothetical protein